MAWVFSGVSEGESCCDIKQGRRLAVPAGACVLGMGVCNLHWMVREGLTKW